MAERKVIRPLAWSGPERALTEHLKRWKALQREDDVMSRNVAPNGLTRIATQAAPELTQWIRFAQTYSRPAVLANLDTGAVVPLSDGDPKYGLIDGRSMAEQEVLLADPLRDQATVVTATAMFRTELELLDAGQTIYVSSEMKSLVEAAANLAEPEPLFPTDLPGPCGMVVFETPVVFDDLHPTTGELIEKILPIRAVAWTQTKVGKRDGSGMTDGIVLIAYTDSDSYNQIYGKAMIDLGLAVQVEPHHRDTLTPIEYHPWAFGSTWTVSTSQTFERPSEGVLFATVSYQRRFLLSLFRLMWQRITHPEPWHPDRHARKRILRLKPAMLDGEITVLRLRRFVDQPHSHRNDPDDWAEWPYPHRIPVAAHWRRQWFPSLGPARNPDGSFNQDSHRLVFIAEHARGPEHLPILLKHHVSAVVR